MYLVDTNRYIAIRLTAYVLFGAEKTWLTNRDSIPFKYTPYSMPNSKLIKHIKRV